jgi:hypothetical protein
LEKIKAAELLLEYGAHPETKNQHNKTPLQLLPSNAVPSTKLFFKKMFEEAVSKLRALDQTTPAAASPMTAQRADL